MLVPKPFTQAEFQFMFSHISSLLDTFLLYSGVSRPIPSAAILRGLLRITLQCNEITTGNVRKILRLGSFTLGLQPVPTDYSHFSNCWNDLKRAGWLIQDTKLVYLNVPGILKLLYVLWDRHLDIAADEKFKNMLKKTKLYWKEHSLQRSAIQGEKEFVRRCLEAAAKRES